MINIDHESGLAVFISIVLLLDAPHNGSALSNNAIASEIMRAK
ncbi:hypothetical protein AND4_15560 [Vibrio sp. AND4]|nr:hypothetical protein AND4_15560 [Vibrio sp. AND4]